MIRNPGISLDGLPGVVWISTGVWLVTVIWFLKTKNWRVGLIMLGGGLNLWQRWQWGYVIDYWKLPFLNLYNNINDWLIFIGGVVLYICQQVRKK